MNRLTKFGILLSAIIIATTTGTTATYGQSASTGLTAETMSFPLGPRDHLRLRVGQWDPMQGIYVPWLDFGGEYLVGSNGTLSLPLIGTLMATGRSPEELADEISVEL